MNLWLDTETRSPEPIKNGVAKYAERAEIILFAWAIDDEEPHVLDRLLGPLDWPKRLRDALHNPDCLVWFQNAWFDWNVLETDPDPSMRYICEIVPLERRRDTMVQAYLHGLPGALEALCAALGVVDEKAKDKRGRALIQRFCVPNKAGGFNRPEGFPEDWEEFKRYAGKDIIAMRECHRRMPKWNNTPKQWALWALDQKINRRGICVDVELARAAVEASEKAKATLARRTQALTNGEVERATQRDQLIAHILETYGIDLPDMTSATLERRIKDEALPDELRELLAVRLESATGSVSKFKTLLRSVNTDGRLRGTMQFRGAARTGRVAHRLFQPGNMPRPTLSKELILIAIDAIKHDYVDLIFDDTMQACSNCIRGTLIPGTGKKLVVADLANIEGRFAAWLAGEEWKLQAFRDYDSGEGFDLYILAYARSFGVEPADVPKKGNERQIGKVEELMLQYGGGVGAFITGAATYSIDLAQMTEQVYDKLPEWALTEAKKFLGWLYEDAEEAFLLGKIDEEACERRKLKARLGLAEKTFVACDAIKRLWRHAHPEISTYWKELEETIRYCIANPGEVCPARKVKMKVSGRWLRIGLPSGRELCYPGVGLDVVEEDPETGRKRTYPGISYKGHNQYSRKWSRISTYGGKIFENCIAEGTEVLTERGWFPIETISPQLRVWDGEEWVTHKGCVYRGKRHTLSAFNVEMTPEHRVLTTEGWQRASSCERHQRAPCRLPFSYSVYRQQRATLLVGSQMPMWPNDRDGRERAAETAEQERQSLLQMLALRDDRAEEHEARHVSSSSLCGVAVAAGALPQPQAPGVLTLRGPWDSCLRQVATVVRRLLGRHGTDVRPRLDDRAIEQQSRLHPKQLHLGDAQSASVEYASKPMARNTARAHDGSAGGGHFRGQEDHAALPARPRVAAEESPRLVFDLIDCGPRSRFVVRGSDGIPLIVHNCTQAVACDQLLEPIEAIEAAGFETTLTIHDEIVSEADADRDDLNAEKLGAMMCADLLWNRGLPLAAAGYETTGPYRKD